MIQKYHNAREGRGSLRRKHRNDSHRQSPESVTKGMVFDDMYATVSDLKQRKRAGIEIDRNKFRVARPEQPARGRSPRTLLSPSRPASRFGSRPPRKRKGAEQHIDVSLFINKAVVTETVERVVPEHQFADFHIDEKIKKHLAERGYITPTPIQDKAIPQILAGNDVVGIANTGTGKTGAFLVPLLHKVMHSKTSRVMIVAPTRELAQQIDAELKLITKTIPIYSAICVGGTYIGAQLKTLRHRNEFIIGTPGRLVDLVDRKAIDLSAFDTLVLDEADRMLDMGFIDDMRKLMDGMKKERQTLLFSATMSREIEKIINQFLREPTNISVKTSNTAKSVDQDVVHVPRGVLKIDLLEDLLRKKEFEKVLVFARTKTSTERIMQDLHRRGIAVASIHGDKTQSLRQHALRQFKEGRVQALIATDVAARGLDISDVSHVINYDIPATYDDYVHRIGRTGRGGKSGKALTFIG